MGGILTPSKEEEIMKFLRQDDSKKLQEFIIKNQLSPGQQYTKHKRTLLQLCCYFESPKCLSQLIEMNYDYNQVESSNGNSPLFISCKFNCLSIVKILLEKDDCKKLVKNHEKFNEFDIAFLKGNYSICYYLLYEYKNKNDIKIIKKKEKNKNENMDENLNINTNINMDVNSNDNNYDYDINQIYQNYYFNNEFDLDNFMYLQETNKYPLFNMPLFFKSLCQRTPPKDCPSFAPERKKTKDLMTKIPDPNETWGHFFKRVVNLELYNPPLVDRKNVTQMNSMYMNTQMKLIENEYGIKMKYYNPNIDDDNSNSVDEEQTPIIKIKKKNNKSKINNNINQENENKEKENDNNEENEKNNENGGNENLGILKVNNYSSERNINNLYNEE